MIRGRAEPETRPPSALTVQVGPRDPGRAPGAAHWPRPVLDTSWSSGGVWSRALLECYRPTRLDAHHETRPDLVGDWNRRSDLFAPASFVTALWDPPYISDAGGGLVGKARWGARYGTRGPGLRADSVCHLFRPFLLSVRQVLDPRHDTLLVKLGDQVHQGELQWQPFELRRVALELGWLPCDYQVRVRAQPLDPKWKTQRHAPRRSGWCSILVRAAPIQALIWSACAPAPTMGTCSGHVA